MKPTLDQSGYEIIENIFSVKEVDEILQLVDSKIIENKFGVREFLMSHPDIAEKVFSQKVKELVNKILPGCRSIKSIYFDKPPSDNWVVNWHQDLTINLLPIKPIVQPKGYKNWRSNNRRTVVQPDLEFLENIFTVRIHLDDCGVTNGALRVVEGSHRQGVVDMRQWAQNKSGTIRSCEVKSGGVMLMKPLIIHSSQRSSSSINRRVIHIEFSNMKLSQDLQWKEAIEF